MNFFKKSVSRELDKKLRELDKKLLELELENDVKRQDIMHEFFSNPNPTTFSNASRLKTDDSVIYEIFSDPFDEGSIENLTLHQCQNFLEGGYLDQIQKIREFIKICKKFTIVVAHKNALKNAEEKIATMDTTGWPIKFSSNYYPLFDPKPKNSIFECRIVENILYINTPKWFYGVDGVPIQEVVAKRLTYLESL